MDQREKVDPVITKLLPGFVLCFGFLLVQPVQARDFQTSYIGFQLPPQWDCQLRKTAWVCRHKISTPCRKNPKKKACQTQIRKSKEAVIIFSAKEVSDVDRVQTYFENLKNPRKFKRDTSTTSQSQVIHIKNVQIQKHKWVDGMHLGSEIPHYYTRYLTTIKGNIAILVTFSAHKRFYTKYSNQFFSGIKSLKIKASEVAKVKKEELGNKTLSFPMDIPDELVSQESNTQQAQEQDPSSLFFILSLITAALGVFIWTRKKKT